SGNPFIQRLWVPAFAGTSGEDTHDGLRPISMTMTLGRCSRRGPADAVTPAMSPSDISAAASACAVGASSFARLAATNTVTPELGESGMPAGGSPTAKPDGATLTPIAARSALSRPSHNGRATSAPRTNL